MDPFSLLNRATQLNPNNIAYWLSRGLSSRPDNWAALAKTGASKVAGFMMQPAAIINRANQLNPNNIAYWMSRGFTSRPDNWMQLAGKAGSSAAATTTATAASSGVLGTVISCAGTALTVYSYVSMTAMAVSGGFGLYRWLNNGRNNQ